VNLAIQVLIVVTGGIVRLTASGLGCPTWPECTAGSVVPTSDQVEGIARFVEFGNRLLTLAVGLAALAVLVGALGWRRRLWPLAALPLAGTLLQAALGGVTVLTRLHPTTVAAHFLLSMLLIAASTVLLIRVREVDGPVTARLATPLRLAAWTLACLGAVVLVLGTLVTGSGPHSGDADEPVRFALDPRVISWLHADTVMIFSGLLLGYLVALRVGAVRGPPWHWAVALAVLVLAQGAVGYTQYALALPRPLVAVHMLLASLFAAALVTVVMSTRSREPSA
jgi:cytochrome c oxidase assembly protein subunit 15